MTDKPDPDAGLTILQMINLVGPDPDFNDAMTAWVEADKAVDRAKRALVRAEELLLRREDELRAVFAHITSKESSDAHP